MKKWNLTTHAIIRLKERYGVQPASAENFINQIMQNAVYVKSAHGNRTIYHHEKRDMFVICNVEQHVVITVRPVTENAAAHGANATNSLYAKVQRLAKREIEKAGAAFRKTQRDLTAQISAIKIELAHAEVNLLNAKGPHIKNIIRKKMDVYARSIDELTAEIGRKESEFERVKADAQAIIGGGEGA